MYEGCVLGVCIRNVGDCETMVTVIIRSVYAVYTQCILRCSYQTHRTGGGTPWTFTVVGLKEVKEVSIR